MIEGVTNRFRLPRIGKIRLGVKVEGRNYPKATDHFVFTDAPGLEKAYGSRCTELEIVFPTEDIDTFFPTGRKAYRATGLFCASYDGQTALRQCVPDLAVYKSGPHKGEPIVDKETGEQLPVDPDGYRAHTEDGVKAGDMFEMECPGNDCRFWESKSCQRNGRLLFLVPKVTTKGCFEISTTSIHGIGDLSDQLAWIKLQYGGKGRLSWVSWKLRLVPIKVAPEGRAKTVYVLELEFRDGGVKRLLEARGKPAGLLMGDIPQDTPDDLYPNAGRDLDP